MVPDSEGGGWGKEDPKCLGLARAKQGKHKIKQNRTQVPSVRIHRAVWRDGAILLPPFWLFLLSRGDNRLCHQQYLGVYSSSLQSSMKA